jgi:hypothetical protein
MIALQNQPSVWELASDDILSVIMAEPLAYQEARFNAGLRPAHLPEPHRTALQAAYDLYDAGDVIHDTTMLSKGNGAFDLTWISQRIALYDALRSAAFQSNVRLAMEEGMNAGVVRLLDIAKTQIMTGKPRTSVLDNLYHVLTTTTSGHTITNESAAAHGAVYRKRLEQKAAPLRSTGFQWLDGITDGIQPATLWWVVAAYKQRKTTLILNLLLAQAVRGESVGFLSGEMKQEQVYWQLIAMLATLNLFKRGLYDETYQTQFGQTVNMNWISGVALRGAQAGYKRWHAEKVKAIDWALQFYEGLTHRIYDSSDTIGGLYDLDSIHRVIGYDIARNKGRIFFGDYIQLFDASGNGIQEKEANKARALQQISRKEGITSIWTAQKNEESVKYDTDNYSAGVSGGGAVPQTADYLLVTKYKQGENASEKELTIQMKLSRFSASGAETKETFAIHPNSGLILGQPWFDLITI